MTQNQPEPKLIKVTLRMDDKHEVRAVRLLLKKLLRAYDLKCIRIEPAEDYQPGEEKALAVSATDLLSSV